MHIESAIETQWHHKGLQRDTVQAQWTYHCVYTLILYVTWVHQRSSLGAVGDLAVLTRDLTSGFFCVVFKWYAEPRRVLCECSECATSHDILQCRCVATAQYEIQLPAPWLFILYDLYSFLIHVAVLWERAKKLKEIVYFFFGGVKSGPLILFPFILFVCGHCPVYLFICIILQNGHFSYKALS